MPRSSSPRRRTGIAIHQVAEPETFELKDEPPRPALESPPTSPSPSPRGAPTELGLGELARELATLQSPSVDAPETRPAPPARDALPDRRLPLIAPLEPWPRRLAYVLTALVVAGLYFFTIYSYWAPAHPGVDQNGYQVGGRLFAQTFSTGVKPPNDYLYVGWMWVRTPDGWYYPKYPLGVPVLDAICLWAGELLHGDGVAWAYLVSPVCAALTLLAIFFMTRLVAGSFAALCAELLLATSPTTLVLANNSNSHAPCLAFVTWGVLCLMWWWRYGGWWRGAIAGFLIGYALTIRYTEGLLLLPLAVTCVLTIRWRNPRSYLRAAVPIVAWLVPVVYLVLFNKFAMGSWTGYDTTNESTGFTWSNFVEKWEQTLNQLHGTALFFIFPLGVFGLVLMYRATWRLALLLTLWFLPGVLLYTSYYWGGSMPGLAFLRFFVTLLPPIIVCAAWLMQHAGERMMQTSDEPSGDAPARESTSMRRLLPVVSAIVAAALCFVILKPALKLDLRPETVSMYASFAALVGALPFVRDGTAAARIGMGLVVAIAGAVSVFDNVGALERDYALCANIANSGDHLVRHVPSEIADSTRRPVLFSDGARLFLTGLNYFQFRGNYECYGVDVFNAAYGRRMIGGSDPDAPNPLQLARREHLREVYKNKTDADLAKDAQQIMTTALSSGRRVFAMLPANGVNGFKSRLVPKECDVVPLDRWRDPVEMTAAGKRALANFGMGAQLLLGRGTPMEWQLVELVKKKS